MPALRFAANDIREALKARPDVPSCEMRSVKEALDDRQSHRVFIVVDRDRQKELVAKLGIEPLKIDKPQAYAIRVKKTDDAATYVVLGADVVGAMYGGLDIAEAIRLQTDNMLANADREPHIARRGIKFNIPLDARTPSYSDSGDAAQQNIPEMWDRDFWHRMLDAMARHRFNVLSLWNLHPFPSLVKVPEYPDIALDDVKRTTVKFDSTFQLTGRDMVRPQMLENLETVRRMTIDEKIRFWQEIMKYANDRGIEVYLFTWNIFTWGVDGKYGITSEQTNPTTIDYFRCSVRATLETYPLLAGIGITAGENMQNRQDEFSKERWLWKTYGEGIRDVKRKQPNRSIRLIHRYHETNLKGMLDEWQEYPDTFDVSFKYAIAHMYSSPAPPFAKKALADLPSHLRMWMTVRNDDVYSFRWGDPQYARDFIGNLPGPDKLAGYYMGPDGYIWGREFLSTEPETPRQLVIEKQWLSFMLWGRLSYDPSLPDDLFERTLSVRFPGVPADTLMETSRRASRIIPLVTRFYWNDIDLKWFPEACISHPTFKGFHTVTNFIEGKSMPESGILSIGSHCDGVLAGKPANGVTPPEVATELRDHAAATLASLAKFEPTRNRELRLTLGDLAAMAHLGNYYAAKIEGATALAMFDRTGNAAHQASAIQRLEEALGHWKQYAAIATAQYKPQLLTRVGMVDLNALTAKVEADIAIARQWKRGD
jgi:hypothetical protein